jgi:hypothetical protein
VELTSEIAAEEPAPPFEAPAALVPFSDELWPQVQGFLRAAFPEAPLKADRDYFDWRFRGSPLGTSLDQYFLLIERGAIVGQIATLRDRIRIGSTWHEARWLVDLIVSAAHRGGLGAARLIERVKSGGALVLGSGVTPNLERFYTSLKFRRVEASRTLYQPIHPSRLARAAGLTLSTSRRLALAAGDGVLALAQRLRARLPRGRNAPLVEEVGADDPRLEPFLARMLPGLGVTTYRDPSWMRWRFERRPVGKHALYVSHQPGSAAISGFAAMKWLRRDSSLRWMEVADLLVAPGDIGTLRALTRQALVLATSSEVDFIRLRCSHPFQLHTLRGALWLDHTRPSTDDIYVWSRNESLAAAFAEGPHHFTGVVADRINYAADEWT